MPGYMRKCPVCGREWMSYNALLGDCCSEECRIIAEKEARKERNRRYYESHKTSRKKETK